MIDSIINGFCWAIGAGVGFGIFIVALQVAEQVTGWVWDVRDRKINPQYYENKK